MKKLFVISFSILAWFLLAALPKPAHAACYVIRTSCPLNGDGSNWNCASSGGGPGAYNAIPTLTRGNSYYFADGSTGAYNFETPEDGTHDLISFVKAVAADHCTDTGWNASTMGSAQFTFNPSISSATCWNFMIATGGSTGDFVMNGNVGSGFTKGSYGFYFPMAFSVAPSDCTSWSNAFWLGTSGGYQANNITIKYVEIAGSCNLLTEDSSYRSACDNISNTRQSGSDIPFYVAHSSSIIVEHNYIYKTDGNALAEVTTGNSNLTFEYNYSHLNNYTQYWHTNIVDIHGGNTNLTFAYNNWNDTEGSAGITSLNAGTPGTDSNVYIYGNVYWWTSGNPTGRGGFGDGAAACLNGNNCPGWVFYNNTVAGMPGSQNAGVQWWNGSTGTPDSQDNLWYNICGSSNTVTFTGTHDYNTFLNVCNNDPASGTHEYHTGSGSASPFVSSSDFHLSRETVDPHLNDGIALPSAYKLDPDGNTRGADGTWERGAYEYGPNTAGSTSSLPEPPANVSAIVN